MYTKKIFIALLGILFLPTVTHADYTTAYNQVLADYERGLQQFSGNSSNIIEEDASDRAITPPLFLPQIFGNRANNQKENKISIEQPEPSQKIEQTLENEEVTDNKLAYQSDLTKQSLRQEGNFHFSASVKNSLRQEGGTRWSGNNQLVNTNVSFGQVQSSTTPYVTLFVIILMLIVLVVMSHIIIRKRNRMRVQYPEIYETPFQDPRY